MIGKVKGWLKGKKTYLMAAGILLTSLAAWAVGEIDLATLGLRVLEAAGLSSLRAAVSKLAA